MRVVCVSAESMRCCREMGCLVFWMVGGSESVLVSDALVRGMVDSTLSIMKMIPRVCHVFLCVMVVCSPRISLVLPYRLLLSVIDWLLKLSGRIAH